MDMIGNSLQHLTIHKIQSIPRATWLKDQRFLSLWMILDCLMLHISKSWRSGFQIRHRKFSSLRKKLPTLWKCCVKTMVFFFLLIQTQFLNHVIFSTTVDPMKNPLDSMNFIWNQSRANHKTVGQLFRLNSRKVFLPGFTHLFMTFPLTLWILFHFLEFFAEVYWSIGRNQPSASQYSTLDAFWCFDHWVTLSPESPFLYNTNKKID